MVNVPDRLVIAWRRLLAFLPERLPTSQNSLSKLCHDCLALYGLPDNDNTQFIIASMVQHLPPTKDWATKRYLGRCVRKFLANETAYNLMEAQKLARKKLADSEKEKLSAEASAN